MRLRSLSLLAIALQSLVSAACGPAEPEYYVVDSPSGGTLRLKAIEESPRPDGARALLLRYRTDLDFSDARALEREVTDVWAYLRPRAEALGLRVAVIQAAHWEPPSWQRRGAAAEYVVKRSANGSWARAGPVSFHRLPQLRLPALHLLTAHRPGGGPCVDSPALGLRTHAHTRRCRLARRDLHRRLHDRPSLRRALSEHRKNKLGSG